MFTLFVRLKFEDFFCKVNQFRLCNTCQSAEEQKKNRYIALDKFMNLLILFTSSDIWPHKSIGNSKGSYSVCAQCPFSVAIPLTLISLAMPTIICYNKLLCDHSKTPIQINQPLLFFVIFDAHIAQTYIDEKFNLSKYKTRRQKSIQFALVL